MVTRIKEGELATVEVRKFTEFLAAAPGETGTGVSIYSVAVMPGLYAATAAAKVMSIDQLVIEVENPDDAATVERLRMAIIARFKA